MVGPFAVKLRNARSSFTKVGQLRATATPDMSKCAGMKAAQWSPCLMFLILNSPCLNHMRRTHLRFLYKGRVWPLEQYRISEACVREFFAEGLTWHPRPSERVSLPCALVCLIQSARQLVGVPSKSMSRLMDGCLPSYIRCD